MGKTKKWLEPRDMRVIVGAKSKLAWDPSLEPGFVGNVWAAVCGASPAELRSVNSALDQAAARTASMAAVDDLFANHGPIHVEGFGDKMKVTAAKLIPSHNMAAAKAAVAYSKQGGEADLQGTLVITEKAGEKSMTMKRFGARKGLMRGSHSVSFGKVRVVPRKDGDE